MNTLDRPSLDANSPESVQAFLEHALHHQSVITTAEGLQAFDALTPVDIDFMLGRWKGMGLPSHHPMDGLLEAANWYGKEFVSAEHVHPLLFSMANGDIIKVAPNPNAMKMTMSLPLPQNLDNPILNPVLKLMLSTMNGVLKTEDSQARLRMMDYRGKVSATMIYDHLPINDSFRKIDDNQVLGVMDYKEIEQPFFFALTRES